MKKTIIHTITVKKQSAKLQSQIKLPRTIKRVKALKVTSTGENRSKITSRSSAPVENEQPPTPTPAVQLPEAGWLWLRVPEKRDVFYSEIIRHPQHKIVTYTTMKFGSLGEQREHWFFGTKKEFFRVDVPITDTLIECFYVDRTKKNFSPYKIKVYLELEL